MKEIICKSPKEYLDNVKTLEEKGLCGTGNSYHSKAFAEPKTREVKVVLRCVYVK